MDPWQILFTPRFFSGDCKRKWGPPPALQPSSNRSKDSTNTRRTKLGIIRPDHRRNRRRKGTAPLFSRSLFPRFRGQPSARCTKRGSVKGWKSGVAVPSEPVIAILMAAEAESRTAVITPDAGRLLVNASPQASPIASADCPAGRPIKASL